jgi:hypothetical protein
MQDRDLYQKLFGLSDPWHVERVDLVLASSRYKRLARGYRNLEHFKIAILFHCGGLDLQPATH